MTPKLTVIDMFEFEIKICVILIDLSISKSMRVTSSLSGRAPYYISSGLDKAYPGQKVRFI